jgi:hypothetical protein
MTNSDLQNTKQKTKERPTRTPLKTGDELRCFRRVSSSCSTCGTRHITVKRQAHNIYYGHRVDTNVRK